MDRPTKIATSNGYGTQLSSKCGLNVGHEMTHESYKTCYLCGFHW